MSLPHNPHGQPEVSEHKEIILPQIKFPRFLTRFGRGQWLTPGGVTMNPSVKGYEVDSLDYPLDFDAIDKSVRNFNSFLTERGSKADVVPGNEDFWGELLKHQTEEIYFIDKYFSSQNLLRLLQICERYDNRATCRVHVLIGAIKKETDDARKREIRGALARYNRGQAKNKVSVYLMKRADREIIHDRFVVFGKENVECTYWHFGASAGGMMGRLNAFSGPWLDKQRRFAILAAKFKERADPITADPNTQGDSDD